MRLLHCLCRLLQIWYGSETDPSQLPHSSPPLKACLHLICFNALPKPVFWTSSKRSVLMRIDTLWRVYTILFACIIWLQSTGSDIPSSCFTKKEKCNHMKDSWKNGSTGSTPTRACFMEKALALCQNARVIWEKFFKVYHFALLQV